MLKDDMERDPGPLLTCKFSSKELGFTGYLVIDSVINGRCCGGVRVSSETTLDETIGLARNMTLKFGFLGIPLGGAKVAIRTAAPSSKNRKRLIFAEVGKILSPLIIGGSYTTGTDMGTTDEDIDCLLNAATNEERNRNHQPTSLYTGWTMLVSALEALKHLGLRLHDSTIAIEGFGKIGSSAAKVFSENGARIVAVSTRRGGIRDSQGLNVERLLEMRKEYGDDVVKHYTEASTLARGDLIHLPVDILLPCAGSWTIDSTNAPKIKSRIICPGANMPTTPRADDILFDRKIIGLPDFVSNSGGVLGAFMGSLISERDKREIVRKLLGKRVSHVIQISREKGIPPTKVAQKIAMERFNKVKGESEIIDMKRQVKRLVRLVVPKIYRHIFVKPRSRRIFTQMLDRT